MPAIKLLAENNVRQGFVEPPLFTRIATRLLEPLNDIAWFAYLSGWRKSEITTLEWGDVDREGQRVTLRRERSKTGEPRVLPLIDELVEIIDRRWRAREYTIRDGGITLSRYVFHRHGQRVVEFRKPWAEACAAARRALRALPRFAALVCAESGAKWHKPDRCHADNRAQDDLGLSAVPDHERRRPTRGSREDAGLGEKRTGRQRGVDRGSKREARS